MEDSNFRITREQRISLVKLLNSQASREYFTDEEANELAKTLDPGGFLIAADTAADELEENEWFGVAADLRGGVDPKTIIRRVEEITDDEGERGRAIPILQALVIN